MVVSIATFLAFAAFFIIVYYGIEFLKRFIERKFKIHIGSIGFLSIDNLSYYDGKISGPHQTQHSFYISLNKIHLQIKRPNVNRKTWFTIIIEDAYFKFSSIKIFLQDIEQRGLQVRKPILIAALLQKAWWLFAWVGKYFLGKLSTILLQFFLSKVANYVDINVGNVNILIEDLGQFQIEGCTFGMSFFAEFDKKSQHISSSNNLQEQYSLRNHHKFLIVSISFSSLSIRKIETDKNPWNISPTIFLIHTTEIFLSCYLSPDCTSLISFDINIYLNRIYISVDSIIGLIKVIQSKIPPPLDDSPQSIISFMIDNLLDSSLDKKMSMNLKVNLIDIKYEFSGLDNQRSPLTARSSIEEFSVSLKQNNIIHLLNNQQRSTEEIIPIKSIEFSVDHIHGNLVDHHHNTSRIKVEQVESNILILLIFQPLNSTADVDPISLSLNGTFNVLSPEISLNCKQFDAIRSIILGLEEKSSSPNITESRSALIYNLVLNFKSRNMKLYIFDYNLTLNRSLEFNLTFSALGLLISINDKNDSRACTISVISENFQVDISWIINQPLFLQILRHYKQIRLQLSKISTKFVLRDALLRLVDQYIEFFQSMAFDHLE
ncbi:10681_t:CDS:2 [Funneliformis geosporum]|uniref:10082_t:CDS:1 n=1 Tax=Funneliformis geosporum TaxID=1117311 RepID=A0A9W4SRQ0_9GLOM|nr:10082_t:CDS:2 [Funneliformis geosporum]CAI2182490.1 10681_t:CDS:2 [Funneliformis geosporum]